MTTPQGQAPADDNTASGAAARFTKKPVTITASQWFKPGDHPMVEQYDPEKAGAYIKGPGPYGWIKTLEGGHIVSPGDWIITGVAGEHYPCKPDIFAATYSRAALASAPAQPVAEPAEVSAVESNTAGAALEPIAYLHDDGYWSPAKTSEGRKLNDRLQFAGSPKIGVHLAVPTAQAAPAATHPIAPDVAADLERSDWTPEEALRWYAAGRHYDTVPNGDGSSSARILDNGAVASNALKTMSRDYAEHKGDVALMEGAAPAGVLEDAAASEVLMENSGCGSGTQVDMLTVRLNPGDKVIMLKGRITQATDAARKQGGA